MQNQIQNPNNLDPSTTSNDDFLEQIILSNNIPNNNSYSWSELKQRDFINETPPFIPDNGCFHGFNESSVNLAAKLRQTQITNTGNDHAKLMLQQPLMIGNIDASLPPFKSLSQGGDGPLQSLYNGIAAGSIHTLNAPQQINHSQNFRSPSGTVISQPPVAAGGGGTAAQPKQRVRARRGQATDPHSIAERLRRMRISERMKALQELVPNTNKTDKATMLDEIIDYVKFLQLQVKVLSMSRLGGAAAVAPLVADVTSEGDQRNNNTGPIGHAMTNDSQTPSSNDNLTVTEQQVAKLMEEDMGSAMQYLQGKGLCLMPISLASAISTSTCHNRTSVTNNNGNVTHRSQLIQLNGEGPTSPNMSVLTVQSASGADGSI